MTEATKTKPPVDIRFNYLFPSLRSGFAASFSTFYCASTELNMAIQPNNYGLPTDGRLISLAQGVERRNLNEYVESLADLSKIADVNLWVFVIPIRLPNPVVTKLATLVSK